MYTYVYTVIMMGYLISQMWKGHNTEINVHLFENARDNRRQKTSLKK